MHYLLMIYTDEVLDAKATPEQTQTVMGAYYNYTNEVKEKNVYLGGNALQPTTTATSVRVRDGKTLTTDGPFAETKEQLGGYYLLDCKNLDEALHYAAKIPGAAYGTIEVRPIMVFS
ncbi:MAG TPA: YciI family protein [Bryobacteraceae bacterium]|nr:YciI family protein [Bryobacteraceae bacterium]